MAWNSIGIPQIPKMPRNISTALIQFGGSQLINRLFGNYWGIFSQNGIPLLLVDNVASVKYESKSQISNAPVEQGSFASYNKIAEPYSVSVMMTKASGGVMQRAAFLSLLESFTQSTNLFMVITPEAIYPNCNIVSYDYARDASDGARMIKANIHLQEVREVKVQYTQTKMEQAKPQQDNGKVQAQETPAAKAQGGQSWLSKIFG